MARTVFASRLEALISVVVAVDGIVVVAAAAAVVVMVLDVDVVVVVFGVVAMRYPEARKSVYESLTLAGAEYMCWR